MQPIRILLVDDHALLRSGLRALLEAEPDLEVVGEAGTGERGVELALELRPDVVIMDLSMPGEGGLAATRGIIAAGIGARVLVLTVNSETEYIMPVLEAGASGYVAKHSAAHSARVRLRYDDGRLIMLVGDDGVGGGHDVHGVGVGAQRG